MSLPFQNLGFQFDNSYVRLGADFSQSVSPSRSAHPSLLAFNEGLACELGMLPYSSTFLGCFAGNKLPSGVSPVSQVYAGHQFGHFNPQLGDGRAVLLGEVISPILGRVDLQLKGAGRTPFSRGGDGRAALGPVLREYLLSEAMHALGVPTTRALAAVGTGETVMREGGRPGAVLTRIASSHIRVGTFEYFARRGDIAQVKILADYVIQRHYPECALASNPYVALFDGIAEAQAALVSRWLGLGFVHGVMNTDNTSICAETIDYGPCAFIDSYSELASFSSIDAGGRYAYGNQGEIILWNLARLAECLLRLMDDDVDCAVRIAEERLSAFPEKFKAQWVDVMAAKLGLRVSSDGADLLLDKSLIQDLLALMEEGGADFTLAFRLLGNGLIAGDFSQFKGLFTGAVDTTDWLSRWHEALSLINIPGVEAGRLMQGINPGVIPRNHQVEQAIEEALNIFDGEADEQVFPHFNALLKAVSDPYDTRHDGSLLAEPPKLGGEPYRTFCGT